MPDGDGTQAGAEGAGEGTGQEGGGFTQEQVNELVGRARQEARQRAQQEAQEAAEKAEAERQRAEMGELERANADAKGARAAADEAKANAEKATRRADLLLEAVKAGVQGDKVERFLKLAATEDEEAADEAVKNVLAEFPEFAGQAPAGSEDAGEDAPGGVGTAAPGGAGSDGGAQTPTLADYRAMTAVEKGQLPQATFDALARQDALERRGGAS